MPRPRRGMFRDSRYRGWLWRDRRGGRDVWHRLGEDFAKACAEYDRLRGQAPSDASRAYIRDVAEQWIEIDVEERRVASGRKQIRGNVDRYLVPFLGNVRLCDLNDDHCRRYATHLGRAVSRYDRPLKPSAIRHLLDELRRMLHWCELTKRVAHSPFPSEIVPKIRRAEPRPYTDAEVLILSTLPGKLGFVCRWGIESMLSWCDLAISTAAMIDHRGLLTCTRAKTGQRSVVPVSSAMRAEIRLRIGPIALVPYSPTSSGSVTRSIRIASGIEDFTLHRLRHTGAMLRLRAGWTKDEVQVMLGHASVKTTEIYAGVTERMLVEKAARMPAQSTVNAGYSGSGREPKTGASD